MGLIFKGSGDWSYQRDAAVRAVRFVTGVTSFDNLITLTLRAPEVTTLRAVWVRQSSGRRTSTHGRSASPRSMDGSLSTPCALAFSEAHCDPLSRQRT
jgi:hypothetical protein